MSKIVHLALPVALSHLLLMTMGLVDLAFVRQVGTTATGAVGVGSALFGWSLTIGIGLLFGMDFFVSTAFGAGRPRICSEYLAQGLWLALFTGIPLSAVLFLAAYQLPVLGINPQVIPETSLFLKILSLGLVPVFLFGACRNYLQAVDRPAAPFVTLLIANALNGLFNYIFIFGKLGFPAMGAAGCALSTTLCRALMAAALLGYVLLLLRRQDKKFHWAHFRLRSTSFTRLTNMGLPAAMQMILEVGVFGLSTVLAGGLDTQSLAAHQIVLNIASTTFMVPLGIGAAAAVLVGQALGRNNRKEASKMGWRGLWLAAVFMLAAGIVLISIPELVLKNFSYDSGVLTIARHLLVIAALFQISDGMQTSLTGALRGLGDTKTPVLANLVGHWVIGLPTSLILCFRHGWGISGIWVGLAIGLFVVAGWLLLAWIIRLRRSHGQLTHLTGESEFS